LGKGTLRRVRLRTLIAFATLALLAGCGGDAASEKEVRGVVTAFGEASAKKDYQRICDDLLARSLVDNVEQYGLPCEIALKEGLGTVQAPRLTIGAVTVQGDRASARVKTTAKSQFSSTDTLKLRRVDDQWRIAALG
jgi:hypothetical protein